MSIGSRIKQIRKEADMTQAQFASTIGMKQSPLSQIESDKILPSIDTLKIIRREFNISYDFIIEGNETTSALASVTDEPRNEMLSKIGLGSRSLMSQLVKIINNHRRDDATGELEVNSIHELEHFVEAIIDNRIGKLEGIMQKLLSKVDEKMFEDDLKQEIEKSDQRLKEDTAEIGTPKKPH